MDEKELRNARIRFRAWQQYAEEDEQIAEIALKENGPPNQICFHAQQVAEKYLKGFLAYRKIDPMKTHDLDKLISLCRDLDQSFEGLKTPIIQLNEF